MGPLAKAAYLIKYANRIIGLQTGSNMAYTFNLHKESLKRKFAVYVVVAKSAQNIQLYVGKTGDNNDGCNPLISRCGNHFSYNDIHSQVRNKFIKHESWDYTYVFDHFDDYPIDIARRRACIDKINEMERWLNLEIQNLVANNGGKISLLNPFAGKSFVKAIERKKREAFRTTENGRKISGIVRAVLEKIA